MKRGAIAALIVAASCTGQIAANVAGGPGSASSAPRGSETPGGATPTPSAGPELAALSAIRRLTSDEYDNTVRDLLGDTVRGGQQLLPNPSDPRSPFDNAYRSQIPSTSLVEGAELLASDIASRLMADPSRRDRIVGCAPAGPDDAVCFRQFVTRFGRHVLRRPLGEAEIQRSLGLQSLARAEGDFYAAVDAAVRAFLQDPEFLYRVEIGTPVPGAPGLLKLNDWELASRLSYFLLGTMPPDSLFARAEQRRLGTSDGVRAAATELLDDSRARDRIARFHALWMGYETLPQAPELAAAMKAETTALIGRVVFDDRRPWQDLFRSKETFVTELLARHYGLPSPGPKAAWVSYGTTPRRGLMSHGSFLSLGAKSADTSPVLRGKVIRERIFCQEPLAKPDDVTTDSAMLVSSPCKWDKFAAHRQGGCAGCHKLMDPVGFGLENYDRQGKYREYDSRDFFTGKDIPPGQCPIKGEGELVGVGTFKGPAGLEDLGLESALLGDCATVQLYRFAIGRYELDGNDRRFVDFLRQRRGRQDFRLDELLLDFVSTEAFSHRRVEP